VPPTTGGRITTAVSIPYNPIYGFPSGDYRNGGPGAGLVIGSRSSGVPEVVDPGYTASYSADCTGSIALGESKTCTITNDDKPAGLTVIKRVVNDNAYELDLPPQLQIHPVLNISRLKSYKDGQRSFPFRPSSANRPPPAAIQKDGAALFEVKSIMSQRGTGNRTEYLVEWLGYPHWEATWERASSLSGARDAIREYHRRVSEV